MAIDFEAVEQFVDEIRQPEEEQNTVYNAVVSNIDSAGVVWVNIAGSDKETPTALTATEVKKGDAVSVEFRNNKWYIAGNYSDRAAGLTRVVYVQQTAEDAQETAETASENAGTALIQAVAAKKIADDTEQHFWFTETGTDTGAHITEKTQEDFIADPTNGGGNLLARSNGVAVRDGLAELATYSADGQTVYSPNGSRLFTVSKKDTVIGSITRYDPYLFLGNEQQGANYGGYSISYGSSSVASGGGAIAGGDSCDAIGFNSMAVGDSNEAAGDNATALGVGTKASSDNQLAIGKYNTEDTNDDYAFLIGKGSVTTPSNAFTVDWSGNVEASGTITDGTGNVLSNKLNTSVIDAGNTGSISTGGGTYKDATVTFNKTFATAPLVICGFATGATAGAFGRCSCSATSITTTGCTIRFFNGDSTTRSPSIYWIAISL